MNYLDRYLIGKDSEIINDINNIRNFFIEYDYDVLNCFYKFKFSETILGVYTIHDNKGLNFIYCRLPMDSSSSINRVISRTIKYKDYKKKLREKNLKKLLNGTR